MTVPRLPTQAIRDCIAVDDFDGAMALLAGHEASLRAALDGSNAVPGCREAWLELVSAQRDLIEELRSARDEAGRALDRLGRDRRGMAAYLQGGG